MKKQRMHVGTVKSNSKDITKNRGHEYGKGRATVRHDKKTKKREKQKVKKELRDFY